MSPEAEIEIIQSYALERGKSLSIHAAFLEPAPNCLKIIFETTFIKYDKKLHRPQNQFFLEKPLTLFLNSLLFNSF